MKHLNLDMATPEQVPDILRQAATKYYESDSELTSMWQDSEAGIIWQDFAHILERAADACEGAIEKRFGR